MWYWLVETCFAAETSRNGPVSGDGKQNSRNSAHVELRPLRILGLKANILNYNNDTISLLLHNMRTMALINPWKFDTIWSSHLWEHWTDDTGLPPSLHSFYRSSLPVWLESFFQKSLENRQKSPKIPHFSNLWGIFPKLAFYCIFINKYFSQIAKLKKNHKFL